jgi:hypothetical protein
MRRREIFLTYLLLVEIDGHSTREFVTYVNETRGQVRFLVIGCSPGEKLQKKI